MSFDGSGTFNRPVADYVYDTVISETDVNAEMDGIATGLSTCITKDGQTNPTANLKMATYRHTGVGNASARTDYAAAGQVQDSSFIWCGTAGGTNVALTLSPTPVITAYVTGQRFRFQAGAAASDAAVTIAVSSLAAKAGQFNDAACSATVVIEANKYYEAMYDGTAFQLTRMSIVPFDSSALGTMAYEDILSVPAMTYAGTQGYADQILQRPVIKDYGETVNPIGSIGGGSQDIDLTLGNVITGTVDTSETTFTVSNPPATGTAGSFTLILTNGGSQTVNWPASFDWPGGTAPSLTTSGVDIVTGLTVDGGTTWRCGSILDVK